MGRRVLMKAMASSDLQRVRKMMNMATTAAERCMPAWQWTRTWAPALYSVANR